MYPFQPGTTHILAGQSGAGKSMYVYNILKHQNVMFGNSPPKQIKYYYGIDQPLYEEMRTTIPNISFQLGLPSQEDLEEFTDPSYHTLIIIDDLMESVKCSSIVEDIFTKISHHRYCSCFLLLQNLYVQGKCMRTINLNAKYITVFRNPRDAFQLQILGRQLFPTRPNALLESFEDCLENDKFAYLTIDLTPHTPHNHRMRTRIFPSESTIVYAPT